MTIQNKPKILLVNRPTKSLEAWKNLQEAAEVVVIEQLPHDEQAVLIAKTVAEQGPFVAWGVGFVSFRCVDVADGCCRDSSTLRDRTRRRSIRLCWNLWARRTLLRASM